VRPADQGGQSDGPWGRLTSTAQPLRPDSAPRPNAAGDHVVVNLAVVLGGTDPIGPGVVDVGRLIGFGFLGAASVPSRSTVGASVCRAVASRAGVGVLVLVGNGVTVPWVAAACPATTGVGWQSRARSALCVGVAVGSDVGAGGGGRTARWGDRPAQPAVRQNSAEPGGSLWDGLAGQGCVGGSPFQL